MQIDWQVRNSWNSDREAAFVEAERRVAICLERREERLYLGDVTLDRLPAAISSLTWLRELDLFGSPLASLDPIASLINLRDLKAGSLDSPSQSLGFLSGWRELRHLTLISTTPLDLAPLSSCTQLARLDISCSQHPVEMHNLDALASLQSLTSLSFHNMRADSFSIVGELKGLQYVSLFLSNSTTLRGFEQLSSLESLNLHGSPISDLSPLAGLKRLRSLTVSQTNIENLEPVGSLSSLEELNIAGTRISTLHPLTELATLQSRALEKANTSTHSRRGLRSINLSGCSVSDLTPLSGFAGLERVDLNDTPVKAIEPLHGLPSLISLNLDRSLIQNLGRRGTLSGLQFLTARETLLDNLLALEPALLLQVIDVSDTHVANLEPLRDALNCRTLILRGSRVNDLGPIVKTGSREEDHRYSSQKLDFRDTPAAQRNSQLAALAAIAEIDSGKCFHETKRYLQSRTASSF